MEFIMSDCIVVMMNYMLFILIIERILLMRSIVQDIHIILKKGELLFS